MNIRDFDLDAGQAFQGDIAFVPIPQDIKVAAVDEIAPIDGRLIIQEGEASGHHHAITLARPFKPDTRVLGDPAVMTQSPRLRRAFGGGKRTRAEIGTAHMYRDMQAVNALVSRRVLTRSDLTIGLLVIEGAPMVVSHEEHDGIRLPVGNYYVGRQVESAGAEERMVFD